MEKKSSISRTHIVLAVVGIVAVMGILVAFVLLAFAAWDESDVFRVVVSSSFIASAGKGVTSARARAPGEVDGENLTELTDALMQQDANAAEEDDSMG